MPKVAYLVTDDSLCTHDDITGKEREFDTERAAIKSATALLARSSEQDAEVWVWRLSHVLSKPSLEPVIEKTR